MRIGRQTEILLEMCRFDGLRVLLLESNLLGCHAGNLSNLLLKATNSRLTCILVDYP